MALFIGTVLGGLIAWIALAIYDTSREDIFPEQ